MRSGKGKLRLAPLRGDEWHISKRQVICTELSRAIRLYFEDNDLIAAHLLAGAAGDILRALAKEAGKPAFRDEFVGRVRDEYLAAFIDRLNAEYNFFKHGARDPEAVWSHYHPALTEMLLFEVCNDFCTVFGGAYFEIKLFNAWFTLRHEDLFLPGSEYVATLRSMNIGLSDVTSDNLCEATREIGELLRVGIEAGSQVLGAPLLRDEGVMLTPDKHSGRNRVKRGNAGDSEE